MAATGTTDERDSDWTARHARTERPEKRRVVDVKPKEDDWDSRHAETKRGA
jgi:hypothetical protein